LSFIFDLKGSGSAGPGCRFRSWSGKIMSIPPELDS